MQPIMLSKFQTETLSRRGGINLDRVAFILPGWNSSPFIQQSRPLDQSYIGQCTYVIIFTQHHFKKHT
jgi:hypothetical protein